MREEHDSREDRSGGVGQIAAPWLGYSQELAAGGRGANEGGTVLGYDVRGKSSLQRGERVKKQGNCSRLHKGNIRKTPGLKKY